MHIVSWFSKERKLIFPTRNFIINYMFDDIYEINYAIIYDVIPQIIYSVLIFIERNITLK